MQRAFRSLRFARGRKASPGLSLALIMLAACVTLAVPSEASAAAGCQAGSVVYSSSALKLVAGSGHAPALTVCHPAARKSAVIKLPSDAASVVRAQRFGATVAVLLTRTKEAGGGIDVLEFSASGKASGKPVVVTGDQIRNHGVRGFAVAAHVPYIGVVLQNGLVKTFQIASDGSTTPFGQGQAYSRVAPTSLRLDPAHEAVKWTPSRKGSATVVASLLAKPGCKLGGTDIKVSPEIRVFKVHEEYWACELQTGKVTDLSPPNIDNFNYDDPGAPTPITIAGHFVQFTYGLGFDPDVSVTYFMVADVANARVTTPLVTSASDTDIVESSSVPGDSGVILTDTGSIALVDWIFEGGEDQQAALCPSLPVPHLLGGKTHEEWVLIAVPFGGKPRPLDCQVDPVVHQTYLEPRTPTIANVALAGHTLTWTSVDQPRSAPLE